MRTYAYYNEHDKFAAAWLRELIKAGLIADGDVDERSIEDVSADDVRGFTQCHWFAGIGGWSYALRLAGWPDDREVWTFSCPCLRFSSATRGRTAAPDMWPEQRRLLAPSLPRVFFGEQVASSMGSVWFNQVCDDVEALGYVVGAAVLPAVSVGFDHARPRIYFVGDTNGDRQSRLSIDAEVGGLQGHCGHARSMVPSHGLSRDMVALSGFGNAIVPQVAAAFIEAYLECNP
jgi:DNA (cytosine-5)-methyltransferase 1